MLNISGRATESKCKLMLAKSPESVHKKIGADRSSIFRVIVYGTGHCYISASPIGLMAAGIIYTK